MNPLQIVSVPIGNISDISERAIAVLKEADCIIAEDTRRTGMLLAKLGLQSPGMISYRDQNHDRAYQEILDRIKSGQKLALVSDSGTPLVSDPGYKLVRDLVANDVDVVAVPGASAVLSALVVSALPPDKFMFLGFLPKKGMARFSALDSAKELEMTFIVYESPKRILKLLKLLAERYGDSLQLSLCKELTKLHESVYRGTANELLELFGSNKISEKGEWVVVGAFKQ